MTREQGEAHWPDVAGRLTETGHILPVRVYYEDTDFSGVVYHAAYLKFAERGRSDFLRLRGIRHAALEAGEQGESLAFVVRRMELDFHAPARIDDLLEVETSFVEARGARLVLDQAIRREGTLLFRASVTVVMVSRQGRPRRLPAGFAERLSVCRSAP